MSSIIIRNIKPEIKEKLRIRAAEHGRSVEAEVRHMLQTFLSPQEQVASNLFQRIHERFRAIGGVELDPPARSALREPPHFE
ncbi:MAG: plasmid stabilization protein [Rhodospirillales bacterium 20-60-12]|nr:MAG: plasmid stabilization protein [Rhodospirillales bacterium 20-60-12]HQT68217.1 Arc family DNA-binding protein [Acetobacteraceae bacterium]